VARGGIEPSTHGFSRAGVLELLEGSLGNAFRAVYMVEIAEVIYALHCFQKKLKCGIEKSSENIFADIGFTNDQEMLVKANLALKISEIIAQRRLT
jgi:hypothetical protein